MNLKNILLALIALVTLAVIVFIVIYMGSDSLTSRENVLFSVLLTVLSIGFSIIISHFYYESSRSSSIDDIKKDYQSNLTLYAEKAAEKVDNLSNELTKLSLYLQQEDEHDFSSDIALLIKEEKIRSSIHIIETLKSVNDKSLSDWRGVIPEEDIEEKNEMRSEREAIFKQLVDSYQSILKDSTNSTGVEGVDQEHDIKMEILTLNKKIDRLATSIIGTPIKKNKQHDAKRNY